MTKEAVMVTGGWDTRISRRTLLRTGGSAAAGLALLGAPGAQAQTRFEEPFSLGVASGDPTAESVVLWTRLAPMPLSVGGGMPQVPFLVRVEVAADPRFRRIVRRGVAAAFPAESHAVHAEVRGLQPSTWYWYRFKWGTAVSPVGRTRTAPAAGSVPDALAFAFVSCQNYTNGFYGAYADLARQDVELVVHLGDYIYEGPGLSATRVRDHVPAAELMSLNDYRVRHSQYKTDPDLQAAHAAFPWVMTWDDHEFKDNYANLDLDPDRPLEDVMARRAAAYRAYWEHVPLSRKRKPVGENLPLFRRVDWGALATFHVLDARQYRSDQMAEQCTGATRDPASGYCPEQLSDGRGILGTDQRDWLLQGLGTGGGWDVLANQVGFAPFDFIPTERRNFRPDTWDGYVHERQSVLDHLAANGLTSTVVITGDSHEHSVRNVPGSYLDMASAPVATEFLGTSISSEGDPAPDKILVPVDAGNNPHILWGDRRRGYVRVDMDAEVWRSSFRVVDTVRVRETAASTLAVWAVERGAPGAVQVSGTV